MSPPLMSRCLSSAAFVLMLGLVAPAKAQGAAELIDRIQRLEAQLRTMNGQVEQLQFQNREMGEQLKRFQSDAEFRFGELEKGKGGAAARPLSNTPSATAKPAGQKRSDAFDPTTQAASPGAAPKSLGEMSAQASNDNSLARPAGGDAQPAIIATTTKEEFDQGVAQMKRREYAYAEQTFRAFIQQHPKDKLVASAHYQIGESHYLRKQYREAAESFLKVSTDFSKSNTAPGSLLRLGQSLQALGEKDAACGALAEVNRKYPAATAQVKQAVASEQKKSGCGV